MLLAKPGLCIGLALLWPRGVSVALDLGLSRPLLLLIARAPLILTGPDSSDVSDPAGSAKSDLNWPGPTGESMHILILGGTLEACLPPSWWGKCMIKA